MATAKPASKNPPVIIFHGDKGGVGKSTGCTAFVDWLFKTQAPVGLCDGDTRNPDVSRMFADVMPVCRANLRNHDGWMDLFDFVAEHPDKTVVISMPAGIGGDFRSEATRFIGLLEMTQRELGMFWVINRLADSVNLLNEAMETLGTSLKHKYVMKNLFFGPSDKFTRWDISELKKAFDKSGGHTLDLPELNERVIDKLFADNDNIMPFSSAVVPMQDAKKSPHGLTPSENLELIVWLQENHKRFEAVRAPLGVGQQVTSE